MILFVYAQVLADTASFQIWLAIGLFVINLIATIIVGMNKKLDNIGEARLAKIETFINDDAVTFDDCARIIEDIKRVRDEIEQFKRDRERRDRDREKRDREIDHQFYQNEKQTTAQINEISTILARISPK